jgi:hypothetical protein
LFSLFSFPFLFAPSSALKRFVYEPRRLFLLSSPWRFISLLYLIDFFLFTMTSSYIPYLLIITLSLLQTRSATAQNDWNTPCFNGVCQYDSPTAGNLKVVCSLSLASCSPSAKLTLRCIRFIVGFGQCDIGYNASSRLANPQLLSRCYGSGYTAGMHGWRRV